MIFLNCLQYLLLFNCILHDCVKLLHCVIIIVIGLVIKCQCWFSITRLIFLYFTTLRKCSTVYHVYGHSRLAINAWSTLQYFPVHLSKHTTLEQEVFTLVSHLHSSPNMVISKLLSRQCSSFNRPLRSSCFYIYHITYRLRNPYSIIESD